MFYIPETSITHLIGSQHYWKKNTHLLAFKVSNKHKYNHLPHSVAEKMDVEHGKELGLKLFCNVDWLDIQRVIGRI